MANITIQVPVEGDIIAVPNSELEVNEGDRLTIVLDIKVKGTVGIGSGEAGMMVSFAKGDHTTPIIDDPPATNTNQ